MPSLRCSLHSRTLILSKPNVHMVWTTRDGTVKVGVTKKVPASELSAFDLVPKTVEAEDNSELKTDVVVVGTIRPRIFPQQHSTHDPRELTQKRRPCPGGFSCGHAQITAGTLGIWVKRDGEDFILSNNHVLADSNAGTPGDWILQPGRADGGFSSDPSFYVGRLTEFVKINSEGGDDGLGGCLDLIDKIPWPWKKRSIEQPYPNLVDAALAEDFGEGGVVDPNIHKLGRPAGVRDALVGEEVIKAGRTTEITKDPIEAIDLSVQVQYGSFLALFADQLMITSAGKPFSQGGDSGSAILATHDRALVGLLFAGGEMEDGTQVTIANNIRHVREYLPFNL